MYLCIPCRIIPFFTSDIYLFLFRAPLAWVLHSFHFNLFSLPHITFLPYPVPTFYPELREGGPLRGMIISSFCTPFTTSPLIPTTITRSPVSRRLFFCLNPGCTLHYPYRLPACCCRSSYYFLASYHLAFLAHVAQALKLK